MTRFKINNAIELQVAERLLADHTNAQKTYNSDKAVKWSIELITELRAEIAAYHDRNK